MKLVTLLTSSAALAAIAVVVPATIPSNGILARAEAALPSPFGIL